MSIPALVDLALDFIDYAQASVASTYNKLKRKFSRLKRKAEKAELYLDREQPAVKKLKAYTLELFESYWLDNNPWYVVFKGPSSKFAEVSLTQILYILNHEGLYNCDIDAWVDLLQDKLKAHPGVARTMIFTSKCWALINENDKASRKKYIDDRIADALGKEILLFPLLTCGASSNKLDNGGHWTLLKFTANKSERRFYNSDMPRCSATIDVDATNSLVVIEYIEKLMCDILIKSKPYSRLLKRLPSLPICVDGLQQDPDSGDCGVVVLEHIHNILLRGPTKKGQYSHERAGRYRAQMVECLMDPDAVVV